MMAKTTTCNSRWVLSFLTSYKFVIPIFIGRSLLDLILCPHSKVEESFNLQATHDLVYFGVTPAIKASYFNEINVNETLPYDHLQYPGVVPRTFVGPLILATCCQILRFAVFVVTFGRINLITDIDPIAVQFLCRLILLGFSVSAWIRFAKSIDYHFQNPGRNDSKKKSMIGPLTLLITACQFHIPYYSSRMLPNVFALVVVLHSYGYWLHGRVVYAAIGLVTATTVFRCDIVLLLGCIGLTWLIQRQLTILKALQIGIVTGITCLFFIVPIDTIMWQRQRSYPLWAEGVVFYYNAILGKSSNWGVSPWYWYILNAIPKMMLATLPLAILSNFRIIEYLIVWEMKIRRGQRIRRSLQQQRQRPSSSSLLQAFSPPSVTQHAWLDNTSYMQYAIPILGFIMLYSCLGHKEVRFIFPILPIMNMGAALGIVRLIQICLDIDCGSQDKEKIVISWIARLACVCGILCLLATLIGSLIFVSISTKNYPGGDALTKLVEYVVHLQKQVKPPNTKVIVHVDVASAMSGVSLFGQRSASWSTRASAAMSPRGDGNGDNNNNQTIEWIFDKAGYEEEHQQSEKGIRGSSTDKRFTHILTEDPSTFAISNQYHSIYAIPGLPRLDIRRARIVTQDAIYVLERNDWTT